MTVIEAAGITFSPEQTAALRTDFEAQWLAASMGALALEQTHAEGAKLLNTCNLSQLHGSIIDPIPNPQPDALWRAEVRKRDTLVIGNEWLGLSPNELFVFNVLLAYRHTPISPEIFKQHGLFELVDPGHNRPRAFHKLIQSLSTRLRLSGSAGVLETPSGLQLDDQLAITDVRPPSERRQAYQDTDKPEEYVLKPKLWGRNLGYVKRTFGDDLVRSYLNEISGYPILEPEETTELSYKVQRAIKLKDDCQAGLLLVDWGEEQAPAWKSIIQEGNEAKEKIIRANLRLVVSIAKKYKDAALGMDLLDMIQHGNIGLEHATEKFDPNRNIQFSTYATFWIRHSILECLQKDNYVVSIPGLTQDRYRQLIRAQEELLGGHVQPTVKALAKYLDWPPEQVQRIMEVSQASSVLWLDGPVTTHSEDLTWNDILPDEAALGPLVALEQSLLLAPLHKLIKDICQTPRDYDIITKNSGLYDGRKWTYGEIGAVHGISGERVRQLLKPLMAQLEASDVAIELAKSLQD